MKEAVIVDAVRTPIGKYKGALKSVRPDDLAAAAIRAILERNPGVPVQDIEDVILGCANQAGEDNRNVARMAVLLSGLPLEVGGTTVNRLCGSGLDAVMYAARSIGAGAGEIYLAGGTESMTRAPLVMGKAETEYPRGDVKMYDTTIGWRFVNPRLERLYGSTSMPGTAQIVADRYRISRADQDEFAWQSQHKAQRAWESGWFDDEVIPVTVEDAKGNRTSFAQDEHPRFNLKLEQLEKLPPLFSGGTVTAGNASGVNDGASVLLLMSADKAKELGVKPLARFVAGAVAGVEPDVMGLGPIPAVQKVLQRARLSVSDLDLVELNEAFASQSLQCIRGLELDPSIVNVNGGAIALGHPLGASGARILTTLVHEMKRRKAKRGLATMCIGVGQGIAAIVEAVQ
ncbi:acetyl-CoA C-acyltransferase [Paenibacillus sp. JMULE4]|uniref:thiolase family protein n=1 Tax=Paenibacillus sp. JMULE4 TaxID=2518342 RepID=UPI001575884F|nr:acetyl-CoA C-acyltransferase [Paenibacillus sp. JMULE4]NTZ16158.1 acetyl-CoA C-acyltransferase [Paenibacillus sp. JMULE4]